MNSPVSKGKRAAATAGAVRIGALGALGAVVGMSLLAGVASADTINQSRAHGGDAGNVKCDFTADVSPNPDKAGNYTWTVHAANCDGPLSPGSEICINYPLALDKCGDVDRNQTARFKAGNNWLNPHPVPLVSESQYLYAYNPDLDDVPLLGKPKPRSW